MTSVLILALLTRLVNLNQSLWLDEAAQAMESMRPLSQQWQIRADFHPPFFHYLLHFWMWGGGGEWYMRLLSVVAGVAMVGVVYLIGREVAGEKTGELAALFLALAPYHIYYSQELRMYAWSGLWAGLAIYFLLKAVGKEAGLSEGLKIVGLGGRRKWWVGHTVALIGGMYTLYLFWFLIPAELVWLVWRGFRSKLAGPATGFPPVSAPLGARSDSEQLMFGVRANGSPSTRATRSGRIKMGSLSIFEETNRDLRNYLLSLGVAMVVFLPWVPQLTEQLKGGMAVPAVWPGWREISSVGFWKVVPLTFAKFALGRISFSNKVVYGGLTGVAGMVFLVPMWRAGAGLISSIKNEISNIQIKNKKGGFSGSVWGEGELFTERSPKDEVEVRGEGDSSRFPYGYRSGQARSTDNELLIWLWLGVPFVLAWVVSLWVPVNGPWRLLFILPAMYILASRGVLSCKSLVLRKILVMGILGVSVTGNLIFWFNPRFWREDWKGAVKFVQERLDEESVVVFAFPDAVASYKWYAAKPQAGGAIEGLVATVEGVDRKLSELTKDKSEVWRFEYLQELTDPEGLIPEWLEQHRYIEVKGYDFRGVGIVWEYQKSNVNDQMFE